MIILCGVFQSSRLHPAWRSVEGWTVKVTPVVVVV